MTENFPDDPRIADLPDEIRSRFRGRSVPSQILPADIIPKTTVEFLVAKTILPINITLVAGEKQDLFVAATSWVVQAISLKPSTVIASVTLIATQGDGSEVRKTIPIDGKKPVTIIEGFENINFLFKAGEVISIETSADVNLLGSIELVQEGGKIIGTEDPVSTGPPA